MTDVDDVLTFWFQETPEEKWFEAKSDDFDRLIRDRFEALYRKAVAGGCDDWTATPEGCLALVVLLDQFPRNMFRDRPEAFAADDRALEVAKRAIDAGHDTALTQQQRAFLYMPFQHCEDLAEQQRSCDLFQSLDSNPDWYGYADRHREIVERFGRFPHRNEILGRETTPEEAAFLQEPNSSF